MGAKYNFTIEGDSLVMRRTPIDGDTQYKSVTFKQPSLVNALDKIRLFEAGEFQTSLIFTEFGTIDGVEPTDLKNAETLLLTLFSSVNQDLEAVKLTGAQTITGAKTFQSTADGSDYLGVTIESLFDSDFREALRIKAGITTNQRRYFEFVNHLGVRTNLLGFNAQNAFIAFDSINNYHYITCNSNGTSSFNAKGTNQVRINADEGATGTNGMAIYDGTANPSASNIMFNLSSAGIYANAGRLIQAFAPNNTDFIKIFSTAGSAYLQSSLALRLYNAGNKFNFADSGLVDRLVIDTSSSKVKVGIGTSTPNANSILDVVSTTQFSRPYPSMTQAQRTAIPSPQVGAHVYQTDATEGVYVYKSIGWTFAY